MPLLNETRSGVEAIRRDLSNLEDNMNRNKDDLGQRLNSVEDRLVDINKNILATQSVVERSLNESTTTVNEEYLTDHLTRICDKMDRINSRIISVSSAINGTIDSKLDLLDSKQDELDMKVMSVNSELEQNILTNITKQLKKTSQSSHEVLGPCGGEGWTRVAYLDMTDPNTTCPSGWRYNTGYPKRTCGKVSTAHLACDSVFFPVSGGAYTSVCGRIKGYQNSRTDAFEVYHNEDATTIAEPYVSGVSLTHGSPRQHIWTFAASATSSHNNVEACPCNSTTHNSTPPFVGGDYFCESGANSVSPYGFHPDDPLWDGDSCAVNSTCCPFNNPPYFTKQLPNTTTDDLEVRLCWWDREDETPIELLELYVSFSGVNTKEPHHNVLINTQQLTDIICSKMELINVSMREEFRAVERQFHEHKNQTTSELSDLHTSLQSTHTDHLTQICDKMDVIDSRLVSVSSAINDTDLEETEQNIVTNVIKETQKLSNSLHEVMEELEQNMLNTVRNELYDHVHEDLGEFEHDVLSNVTTQLNDLAENNDLHNHVCGSTGGWTRAIYLDMTDPNTNCPSGWRLNTGYSKRTCEPYSSGCTSVFFPVSVGAYNRVCGRVTAYQYATTHAFHYGRATTIDEAYVDGVSLTHGSPRQHIWTFAAGVSEASTTDYRSCPCDAHVKISVPLFVGGDYFCESGANSGQPSSGFHSDDPLWDGKNCTKSSACCSFNNPPYFTKRLSSATTDDIEVRLCNYFTRPRSPIELLEIYTKLDVVDVEEVEHNVVSSVREELKMTYNSLQEDHGRTNVHVCGGTGGWRRVAYLDMTDPITICPSGWWLTRHSKRTCGRVSTGRLTCDSVFFPVSGGAYTSVCGRIKGYQYRYPVAFFSYHTGQGTTINSAYVTGVSFTHGTPRQHIWTFAASHLSNSTNAEACPCNSTTNPSAPPFVGQDYFCESGANPGSTGPLYVDDPLWDGDSCAVSSTCCPFNNPPYFTKRLSSATTDDLEVRLCHYYWTVDTPVEFMELYIK